MGVGFHRSDEMNLKSGQRVINADWRRFKEISSGMCKSCFVSG
jgi:hypothetical protein